MAVLPDGSGAPSRGLVAESRRHLRRLGRGAGRPLPALPLVRRGQGTKSQRLAVLPLIRTSSPDFEETGNPSAPRESDDAHSHDSCGMLDTLTIVQGTGGRRWPASRLQRKRPAPEFRELPMTLAALVIAIVTQGPAGPATVSGQVVDSRGQPASGVEHLAFGVARRRRGQRRARAGEVGSGGPFSDRRPRREGSPSHGPSARRSGPTTRTTGIAGQMFSRSAPPAAGSVKLKLEGPAQAAVRVVGPDGQAGAGCVVWRRDGCTWSPEFSPGPHFSCPTRWPTCSRGRPTPRATRRSAGSEPSTSRPYRLTPPASVARSAHSSRARTASARSSSRRPAG